MSAAGKDAQVSTGRKTTMISWVGITLTSRRHRVAITR